MRHHRLLALAVLAIIKGSTCSITSSCNAISSPPKDVICGQKGNHTRGSDSFTSQTTTAAECRNYCLNMYQAFPSRTPCKAFSHDSATNLCRLYANRLAGDDFVADSQSTVTYTETRCFKCAQNCDLPHSTNLLYNPGFDVSANMLGPWGLQGEDDPYYPKIPHMNATVAPYKGPGNAALLLDTGTGGILQYVGICPGRDYIASVDYFIAKPKRFPDPNGFFGGYTGIVLLAGDCVAYATLLKNSTAFGQWHTITCSMQLQPGDEALGSFGISGVSEITNTRIYLKNPQLRQISSPLLTTIKTRPSLVVNGGFETGDYPPWTVYNPDNPKAGGVTTPGLRKMPGLPASKYKFVYSNMPEYYYYFADIQDQFALDQTLNTTPKAYELYLFTMEYREVNTQGFYIYLGDSTRFFRSTFEKEFTTLRDNRTRIFSRIFSTDGRPFSVSLKWQTSLPGKPGDSLHTLIEIDNVSLRKLTNQSVQ